MTLLLLPPNQLEQVHQSQFFIFQNFIEKLINSELEGTFLKHKFFVLFLL